MKKEEHDHGHGHSHGHKHNHEIDSEEESAIEMGGRKAEARAATVCRMTTDLSILSKQQPLTPYLEPPRAQAQRRYAIASGSRLGDAGRPRSRHRRRHQ